MSVSGGFGRSISHLTFLFLGDLLVSVLSVFVRGCLHSSDSRTLLGTAWSASSATRAQRHGAPTALWRRAQSRLVAPLDGSVNGLKDVLKVWQKAITAVYAAAREKVVDKADTKMKDVGEMLDVLVAEPRRCGARFGPSSTA